MPYYINAPTLSSATAVYVNTSMTTCAPDGYYSQGPIVRQQVGCVLLPEQECPFCGAECEVTFDGPVNKGVYYFSVDLGATTGPVIIRFNPQDYPNGIEAVYDSTAYNQVVSSLFGTLSAPAGLPVFVGYDAEDCGIVGTQTLNEFEFRGVDNSFHSLGTTEVVSVIPSQLQLTYTSPGTCTMVIPKPNATPSTLLVKVISPCPLDTFDISISCPLPSVVSTVSGGVGGPGELICGYPTSGQTYYIIHVNGGSGTLGLYDFLYYDSACTLPLADNYYLSSSCPSPNDWFRIENGIIVEFGECDATFKYNVRQCVTGLALVVISPFPLTIGNLVSLSDPIYEGCKFEVRSVNRTDLPTALVVTQYTETCSDNCVYYKIYNMDSKVADVEYNDCAGAPQTTTIPVGSFIYLCAQIDSISSLENIDILFESCQCPD